MTWSRWFPTLIGPPPMIATKIPISHFKNVYTSPGNPAIDYILSDFTCNAMTPILLK